MLRQAFATLLGSHHGKTATTKATLAERADVSLVQRSQRLRITLIIAIAISALVVFGPGLFQGLHFFGGSSEDVPVLVADQYIAPFQALKPAQIKVRYFPREFVPPGALHAVSEILKEDNQVLYSSIVGIPEGQPLTRTILNETGKEHGMSSLLRPGKVAVSFKVEREKSVGGWVHPGDTIAIFQKIPADFPSHSEHRQTRLLLDAVEVLAVDQAHLGHDVSEEPKTDSPLQTTLEENQSQVVTVLTNTSDATALVEAQQVGPLTIVLRPLGDDFPWPQASKVGIQ